MNAYQKLHDMLSDMIESGRLTVADIPDDYDALVEHLAGPCQQIERAQTKVKVWTLTADLHNVGTETTAYSTRAALDAVLCGFMDDRLSEHAEEFDDESRVAVIRRLIEAGAIDEAWEEFCEDDASNGSVKHPDDMFWIEEHEIDLAPPSIRPSTITALEAALEWLRTDTVGAMEARELVAAALAKAARGVAGHETPDMLAAIDGLLLAAENVQKWSESIVILDCRFREPRHVLDASELPKAIKSARDAIAKAERVQS